MQYIDDNTELSPEWVHENNAFERLVILYNGLKIDMDTVTAAKTGKSGSLTFIDSPDPKIENNDIFYQTLEGNVVAYLEDEKDEKDEKKTHLLDMKYGLLTVRYHFILCYGLILTSAAAGIAEIFGK